MPVPPAPPWFGAPRVRQAGGQQWGMLPGVPVHLGCGGHANQRQMVFHRILSKGQFLLSLNTC